MAEDYKNGQSGQNDALDATRNFSDESTRRVPMGSVNQRPSSVDAVRMEEDDEDADMRIAQPAQDPKPEEQEWPTFDWKEGFSSWEESTLGGSNEAQPEVKEEVAKTIKKKEPKKRKKTVAGAILTALIYLFSVVLVSYGLATFGWSCANDVLALNKEEASVTITVANDEPVDNVADVLHDAGLIQYKFLFKLFAMVTHKDAPGKIVAGTYELTSEMDYSALLTNIGPKSAVRGTVDVMIPEGQTLDEIFEILEKNGVCSAAELKEAAGKLELDESLADCQNTALSDYHRFEGYLFPDTYQFYLQSKPESALYKMLKNFNAKFTDEMRTKAEDMGRSMNEILIIASIIEKETDGYDHNDIASVIYNRLAPGNYSTNGFLQMDSTIQYLLTERKESLTADDLAVESPYNTYLNKGLPPGAICCPGLESIRAALNPSDSNYYYFILGNDGSTHFFSAYNDFINFRNKQLAEAGN